ncbi:LysR family transcriptional regulator substrate-binding protein [Mediterranea massiliensis]|nr:LysR family transcriptional regulator substrate-binding protein [Mediterranea massiliensis]MDM8337286.1 LysR family transcriptional regulator substrate-binding protein [Mediterranea massiliensis]
MLKGTHTRSITEHFFMKNNVNIVPQIEVNDTNLILSLISSGYWYSILAPISIEKNSKCVAIPIENKKEMLSVYLLWMNGKNKNPLFKTFTNEMFTTFNSSSEMSF